MEIPANSQDRMRSILLLVATVATIIFNGLAATGRVNGVTPEVISDKYPTVLTPAGYAFTIWSLIYVGMIAFSIYQMLQRNLVRFRSVRSLYVISCALNCSWIYFWHREQIAVCFGLIFALLVTLIVIVIQLSRDHDKSGAVFTKGAFGLYAGWVTAATLVNFALMLKYLNVELSSGAWAALGAIFLMVAAAMSAFMRALFKNYIYPLAVAWAATAIAVKQSGNTVIIVAAAICVIICLVASVSFVMDQKSSTT
ncbi:MAG: tryptophan-rich sensory protein [Pyrinomonadaceae bacterium]